MELLIYAPPVTIPQHRLLSKITHALDDIPVNLFKSIDSLAQYLRQPICESFVTILFPKDNAELASLITMRHLMRNMRIVLILPNQDKQTISDGHFLRPRYVSHVEGDLSDVVAVVKKMTGTDSATLMQAI